MDKVQAALQLFDYALDFQVEMEPDEAARHVTQTGDYNRYTPELAARLVKQVNAAIPPMDFGGDNPNNGRPFHTFKVGREYSPVIYVQAIKAYLNNNAEAMAKKIAKDLEAIGTKAKADEVSVSIGRYDITARYWWD